MNDKVLQLNQEAIPKRQSLVAKFADRYGVDADKMLSTLKATCFRQRDNKEISNEQMMALLVVADQYKLNPFTKEIFAFPDKSGIVPVVGVDGWSRIINENPALDGIEFRYSDTTKTHKGKTVHDWIDCVIRRKDRSEPTIVREFFDEVVRETSYTTPWDTHPNRMHRHKTLIQCARIAFGFAGIFDEDEAERIVEMGVAEVVGKITPDPVDEDKVFETSVWLKEMIDADNIENWEVIQAGWAKLSNNERLAVDDKLRDKAPNSNIQYRNLLKKYLDYVPSETYEKT